jgi:ATP-dependent Clp protease protease subunit
MTTNSLSPEEQKKQISNLQEAGYHLIMEDIDAGSCKTAIEWILETNFNNEVKKPKHLNLIICSPGGDLSAAFALIDVMRGSSIPIKTTGLGMIASAGLLIFISGEKGKRLLTPNTSILSHQFSWGSFGKEHELFAAVKEFDLTTKRMIKHYKKCTGLSDNDIRKFLLPPQDVWLSAPEALKLGICDDVREMK